MSEKFPRQSRNNYAISLIEVLMVVSIILLLGVSYSSLGSKFLIRSNIQNKTNEVVSTLRTAQLNSIINKNDSKWGVKYTPPQLILFKGDSFSSRDEGFDEIFTVPPTISITPFEIVFDKLTGNPNLTATISISADIGEINIVSVNEIGTVDVN